MDCGNDVAGMAARAGRAAGNPTMILDQMIFVIAGIGVVASGAIRSKTGVDGISHFLADTGVMASGASPWWIVGYAIMECDDLVCGGEGTMAVVTLGAAECDKMAIGLDVAHRVTGDAGDSHWRRRAGKALALLNSIFDILADGVAMADNAIALMDGVDITHRGRDMAGCAAGGDGNHVMLNGCRWDRMVEGILRPVAVGAILGLVRGSFAIFDSVHDRRILAGMALDAGVFGAVEGHDVNNAGSAGVGTVMAVRAEGIGAKVVHMIAPGLNMAERAVWWRYREVFQRIGRTVVMLRFFDIMTMNFIRSDSGDRIDQIVMVAGLAINDPSAGLTIFDCGNDLGCDRSSIDTTRIRRTGAICCVGVAIGAEVIVDIVERGKVTGGVTTTAVFEDIGGATHFIVVDIAVLDAACKRMTGFAGNWRRVAIAAAACRNSVLDLLYAAAVAGLAIAAMGGEDIIKGAAWVAGITGREVAGDGAIGSRAQHVMAGVVIMGGDA